mgnify:CR=1 FL=1
MRLIDAELLEEQFGISDADILAKEEIRYAPTVDAVIVTRCEDCVHWDDDPDTYGADDGPKGKCMKSFETMCADDFAVTARGRTAGMAKQSGGCPQTR